MNIKNLVLLSLLTFASLEIKSASLESLGYAGEINTGAVYQWVTKGGAEKAARAYAAINHTPDIAFSDNQERQLTALADGYKQGSIPAEKVKTPEEIAAEVKAAEDKAAAELKAAEDKAAAEKAAENKAVQDAEAADKAEADRLEKEAERQAAEAEAAEKAAANATKAALEAEAKALREAAEAAAAAAAAEAAKAGEDKAAQEAAAKAAAAVSNKDAALQLVKDIATKVNATGYSGNLKDALHNTAPVSADAHRSKTLGRLGKDKVKKYTKKS